MIQSKRKFAQLLTEGIYRIRLHKDKAIGIIQDELGFAIGREGGTAIEHWRRGHQPARLADLEQLAQLIVTWGQLDQTWLESFLFHGGHPQPTQFSQQLLLAQQSGAIMVSEDGRFLHHTNDLQPPMPWFNTAILDHLTAPGGVLHLRDKFYIEREADNRLKHHIMQPGSITTIRAPRQTGKSSLLVRGLHHARQQDAHVIHLDLQRTDPQDLATADTFLRYLANFIAHRLHLEPHAVETAWQHPTGAQDRLTFFMESAVLNQLDAPLILALDEADRLLDTNFHTPFFALLRAWHNSAAYDPLWEKLHLITVISTEPYLLIADINQSPFNVGLKLYLEDFTEAQITQLNHRHHDPVSAQELPAFIQLLHGHPYLSRQALYTMVTEKMAWPQLAAVAPADTGPFGEHLRRHYWLLQNDPALGPALKQVIAEEQCPDDRLRFRLLRAGLIHAAGRTCRCRCDLYRRYFADKL